MFSSQDYYFMQCALAQAKIAAHREEVPVGAVLVYENEMIAASYNQPITTCDPSAHAEIMVLRQGAKTLRNYRLSQTILYVTLEPCMMCMGAIIQARIKRLVFGAFDNKHGGDSVNQKHITSNHHVDCQGGLLEEPCGDLLRQFFLARRL